MRAWLEAGGDASALSERGTALICRRLHSGAAMVELPDGATAKASYADDEGWTALHAAAGASSRIGAGRPRWPATTGERERPHVYFVRVRRGRRALL